MDRVSFLRSLGVAAIAASSGITIEQASADQNIDAPTGVTAENAEAIRKRLDELFYNGGVVTADAMKEAFMMVLLGRPVQ